VLLVLVVVEEVVVVVLLLRLLLLLVVVVVVCAVSHSSRFSSPELIADAIAKAVALALQPPSASSTAAVGLSSCSSMVLGLVPSLAAAAAILCDFIITPRRLDCLVPVGTDACLVVSSGVMVTASTSAGLVGTGVGFGCCCCLDGMPREALLALLLVRGDSTSTVSAPSTPLPSPSMPSPGCGTSCSLPPSILSKILQQ
jgi:hypothetical protein